MKRLAWTWLVMLIIVPLLVIAYLTYQYTNPATAAAVSLQPSEIRVVTNRSAAPEPVAITLLAQMPEAPTVEAPFRMDFSHRDARGLDLSQKGPELSRSAVFDTQTVWPQTLPPEFQPSRLLEDGKNPGLGVRKLHEQGITGAGVRVAVIDMPLWRDHPEYRDSLASYLEVGSVPAWDGIPALSVLSGKTTGVAPGVKIDYYATQFLDKSGQLTFVHMAAAINNILDDNQKRPTAEKVRVICAPIGASPDNAGYSDLRQAYQRARREGVFLVTSDMDSVYAFQVMGLGREPYADPDSPKSYVPASWIADFWWRNGGKLNWGGSQPVYVPMEARTMTAPTSADLRYYPRIGLGVALPWAAGMYALAVQADPKVTPEQFLKAAHDTGDYVTVRQNDKAYQLGPILNPGRLIAAVKGSGR